MTTRSSALHDALVAVHDHAFDARLTPVTRAYFARLAGLESGAIAADLRALAATEAGKPLDAAAAARLSALPFTTRACARPASQRVCKAATPTTRSLSWRPRS